MELRGGPPGQFYDMTSSDDEHGWPAAVRDHYQQRQQAKTMVAANALRQLDEQKFDREHQVAIARDEQRKLYTAQELAEADTWIRAHSPRNVGPNG